MEMIIYKFPNDGGVLSMCKKIMAFIFLILLCSQFVSSMAADTTPPPQSSFGGPYGITGFSGSGYTGNGFYPTSNRIKSYEVYNPTSNNTDLISSANNKNQYWGLLGLLGFIGLFGLFRFWEKK
ncbi:WGxxGxxG family protein [Paenibacillus sp. GCM10027628]|uniref:WGxxGxxG family protein n=1 Tax=Paenibacillus sp. GCM10027628 TaxID=3273413 RepID=UPI003634942F